MDYRALEVAKTECLAELLRRVVAEPTYLNEAAELLAADWYPKLFAGADGLSVDQARLQMTARLARRQAVAIR